MGGFGGKVLRILAPFDPIIGAIAPPGPGDNSIFDKASKKVTKLVGLDSNTDDSVTTASSIPAIKKSRANRGPRTASRTILEDSFKTNTFG